MSRAISFTQRGSFSRTEKFLNFLSGKSYLNILEEAGKKGVEALRQSTPRDTGKTAESWYYEIEKEGDRITLSFKNSNVVHYVNIAIILQYGHATKNGGWVEGIDYINPTLQPIFDRLANEAWQEIVRA